MSLNEAVSVDQELAAAFARFAKMDLMSKLCNENIYVYLATTAVRFKS